MESVSPLIETLAEVLLGALLICLMIILICVTVGFVYVSLMALCDSVKRKKRR